MYQLRQRHPDVSRSISRGELDHFGFTSPWRRLPCLAVFVSLVLVSLACTLLGPGSAGRVVSLTRLPTLTPTRLPTLTPTIVSTPVVVAQAVEPKVAAPVVEQVDSETIPAGMLAPAAVSGSGEAPGVAAPAGASLLQAVADAFTPDAGAPPPPAVDNSVTLVPPTATATPLPSSTSTATATFTPPPTDTPSPTPTPTVTPLPQGWVFSGVRVFYDQDEGGLRLLGDVINNTGTTQGVDHISGTFYDAQDKTIADPEIIDYWPLDAVPPGGQMPFELVVIDVQSAARFDLRVESEPSGDVLRQDFELLDLNSSNEASDYCMRGKIQNPGSELQYYLVIIAVLYDDQDKVINFSAENSAEIFERPKTR